MTCMQQVSVVSIAFGILQAACGPAFLGEVDAEGRLVPFRGQVILVEPPPLKLAATAADMSSRGLSAGPGRVRITDCSSSDAARSAGLQAGDIIGAVNGEIVRSPEDFHRLVHPLGGDDRTGFWPVVLRVQSKTERQNGKTDWVFAPDPVLRFDVEVWPLMQYAWTREESRTMFPLRAFGAFDCDGDGLSELVFFHPPVRSGGKGTPETRVRFLVVDPTTGREKYLLRFDFRPEHYESLRKLQHFVEKGEVTLSCLRDRNMRMISDCLFSFPFSNHYFRLVERSEGTPTHALNFDEVDVAWIVDLHKDRLLTSAAGHGQPTPKYHISRSGVTFWGVWFDAVVDKWEVLRIYAFSPLLLRQLGGLDRDFAIPLGELDLPIWKQFVDADGARPGDLLFEPTETFAVDTDGDGTEEIFVTGEMRDRQTAWGRRSISYAIALAIRLTPRFSGMDIVRWAVASGNFKAAMSVLSSMRKAQDAPHLLLWEAIARFGLGDSQNRVFFDIPATYVGSAHVSAVFALLGTDDVDALADYRTRNVDSIFGWYVAERLDSLLLARVPQDIKDTDGLLSAREYVARCVRCEAKETIQTRIREIEERNRPHSSKYHSSSYGIYGSPLEQATNEVWNFWLGGMAEVATEIVAREDSFDTADVPLAAAYHVQVCGPGLYDCSFTACDIEVQVDGTLAGRRKDCSFQISVPDQLRSPELCVRGQVNEISRSGCTKLVKGLLNLVHTK